MLNAGAETFHLCSQFAFGNREYESIIVRQAANQKTTANPSSESCLIMQFFEGSRWVQWFSPPHQDNGFKAQSAEKIP
jgi:hypothetical protein